MRLDTLPSVRGCDCDHEDGSDYPVVLFVHGGAANERDGARDAGGGRVKLRVYLLDGGLCVVFVDLNKTLHLFGFIADDPLADFDFVAKCTPGFEVQLEEEEHDSEEQDGSLLVCFNKHGNLL